MYNKMGSPILLNFPHTSAAVSVWLLLYPPMDFCHQKFRDISPLAQEKPQQAYLYLCLLNCWNKLSGSLLVDLTQEEGGVERRWNGWGVDLLLGGGGLVMLDTARPSIPNPPPLKTRSNPDPFHLPALPPPICSLVHNLPTPTPVGWRRLSFQFY